VGRKLMRVPMDFAWPLNKVWGGYLNPFYRQAARCHACAGTGYAPTAKIYTDQWYGSAPFDPIAHGAPRVVQANDPEVVALARRNVGDSPHRLDIECTRLHNHWRDQWSHHLNQDDVDALVAAGRLWDFVRVPITDEQREVVRVKMAAGENSWLPYDNGRRPTAEEVNRWSLVGHGHDSMNQWICVEARCKREGIPVTCAACEGTGRIWPSPEIEKQYDEWTAEEPPAGPGYQLWETTSEGSPKSPVFATLEELCVYAAEHCTTFGTFKATAEQWRAMLEDGFVSHTEGNMVFT
jgi:hypothetical protein